MDEEEKKILTELRKAMEESERNKPRRAICAILIYSACWYWVLSVQGQIVSASILEILANFAVCMIYGGITFYVSFLIFLWLFSKSESENKRIRYYENLLREYDKKSGLRSDSCGTNQP